MKVFLVINFVQLLFKGNRYTFCWLFFCPILRVAFFGFICYCTCVCVCMCSFLNRAIFCSDCICHIWFPKNQIAMCQVKLSEFVHKYSLKWVRKISTYFNNKGRIPFYTNSILPCVICEQLYIIIITISCLKHTTLVKYILTLNSG